MTWWAWTLFLAEALRQRGPQKLDDQIARGMNPKFRLTYTEKIQVEGLRFRVYEKHAAGCCWHILLDGQNIDDTSAMFCWERAEETGHEICKKLGPLILRMSRTQRLKLSRGGYTRMVATQ